MLMIIFKSPARADIYHFAILNMYVDKCQFKLLPYIVTYFSENRAMKSLGIIQSGWNAN